MLSPKWISCDFEEEGILKIVFENSGIIDIPKIGYLIGNKPYRGFMMTEGLVAGEEKEFTLDFRDYDEKERVSKIYAFSREEDEGEYRDCFDKLVAISPNTLCKEYSMRVGSPDTY